MDTDGPSAEAAEPATERLTARVEQLFARIRAGSGTSGPEATEVEAEEKSVGVVEAAEPEGDAEPDQGSSSMSAADRALLEQRSALLDPIVTQLSRKVKRALQDDQNQLLAKLRGKSVPAWREDLLSSEEEQRKALVGAASALLQDARKAGFTFVREMFENDVVEEAAADNQETATSAAEGLAGTVVTLLRRRLVGPDGDELDTDEQAIAERVKAAYREWRGQRIERLVGDYALGAFSSGVLAANDGRSAIRWVLDGSSPACADCDDNALAEAVSNGSRFPTGHQHPPAHAGCRCLVVPALTPV